MTVRYAKVRGNVHPKTTLTATVEAYLPEAWKVDGCGRDAEGAYVVISGEDVAGWTFEDYVQPRLASGLLWASEEGQI